MIRYSLLADFEHGGGVDAQPLARLRASLLGLKNRYKSAASAALHVELSGLHVGHQQRFETLDFIGAIMSSAMPRSGLELQ